MYHSKINNSSCRRVGNFALLSFRTKVRGPIATLDSNDVADELDVIDEALLYFRANVFFKTYEIQGDSDRVLIYATLYISECLKRLQKATKKSSALSDLHSLSIAKFDIPGDANFPLSNVYTRPTSNEEADLLRQYLTQLRQEIGLRLCERVFESELGRPSKWWTCFAKRRFMDISLSGHGL